MKLSAKGKAGRKLHFYCDVGRNSFGDFYFEFFGCMSLFCSDDDNIGLNVCKVATGSMLPKRRSFSRYAHSAPKVYFVAP